MGTEKTKLQINTLATINKTKRAWIKINKRVLERENAADSSQSLSQEDVRYTSVCLGTRQYRKIRHLHGIEAPSNVTPTFVFAIRDETETKW